MSGADVMNIRAAQPCVGVPQALDLELQEDFPEEVVPGWKSSQVKNRRVSGQSGPRNLKCPKAGSLARFNV